ncbi:hypothetical protein AciPR4_3975 [Terriglobus saanensis SP1PR4]|uniref:Uncharacterized protein n=1 Tax=Terriglobus saanensis (strain ATCC BAA-1853 / DSM 23119 / SP1PR4) TaxID=401053 RepID=E8V3N7_TERSS|nr:hypothetical protein AciPR4_3975 [Terriglobus saanensis SP1PR4]
MDKDFKELLSLLNEEYVRYLVVGGYAVNVYSQPRATKDLDILISNDRENAEKTYRALIRFGAPLAEIQVSDFEDPDIVYHMGQPPLRVDILKAIDGVLFEQAWESRVPCEIDGELTAFYIGSDALIQNKLASGRLRDLADVEAIRAARKARA